MATKTRTEKGESKLSRFEPGSAALEALLQVGYGMTKADADLIISEYKANPLTHPYEVYKKAQAFLEAFNASPKVVSTRPAFSRSDEFDEE